MPPHDRDKKREIDRLKILRHRKQMMVVMPLILLFECALFWNVGFFLYHRFPLLGTVIMFLGLLCFTCIAILSSMQYLKRTKTRIMLFLVIFAIGCLANFFCHTTDLSDLNDNQTLVRVFLSYCSAIAEFFPSRGMYDTPTGNYAWTKILFYYLSCVFSISIVIAIWGGKITNRWRLFLLRFLGMKRNVFWCDVPSQKEFMLANDIYTSSYDDHCVFNVEEAHIDNVTDLQSNRCNGSVIIGFARSDGNDDRELRFFLSGSCEQDAGFCFFFCFLIFSYRNNNFFFLVTTNQTTSNN